MRKAISSFIATVILLSCLAGCGTQATTTNAITEKAETSVNNVEEATDKVEETTSQEAGEAISGNKSVPVPGGFEVIDVTPNKEYKIVVTNINTSDANAATAIDGFKAAGEYYGVEVIVMDNKGDPVQAAANAEAAINMEADFFFEYNADGEANKRIGERLKEANLPAIAVQVPLGDDYPYFRLDPKMSGEASGLPLAEQGKAKFGDDVEFLVALGYPEAGPVIQERSEAAIAAVKTIYPDIKVIEYSSKADTETSRSGMQDILTANPEGNFLFWAHHDQFCLAAYNAIKAAGREENCVVTSIVALPMMTEEIQNPDTSVYGTVSIRPEVWGWMTLPLAIQYLNDGTEIPKDIYQPCVLVTKDNIGEIYPDRVK